MKAEFIITIGNKPDAMGSFPVKERRMLVRCRDCKKGELDTEHFVRPSIVCRNPMNGVGHISHSPDWICADGERK